MLFKHISPPSLTSSVTACPLPLLLLLLLLRNNNNNNNNNTFLKIIKYYKYAAYVCTGLFIVWIIIGLVLFMKFIVAIRIIQEASIALRAMPMLIFFPFITVAAIAVLLTYWTITTLYIFTIGEITAVSVTEAALGATSVDLNLNVTLGAYSEWGSTDLKWCVLVPFTSSFSLSLSLSLSLSPPLSPTPLLARLHFLLSS